MPNNYSTGNISNAGLIPRDYLPHNLEGPSRAELSLVFFRMFVTENFKKNLYLHNPGLRVNDLRTRRSRSGAVKVLISPEIDEWYVGYPYIWPPIRNQSRSRPLHNPCTVQHVEPASEPPERLSSQEAHLMEYTVFFWRSRGKDCSWECDR